MARAIPPKRTEAARDCAAKERRNARNERNERNQGGGEGERGGGGGGRRRERDTGGGVSTGTTGDIALCFLSGQMIYRVSPYIAGSYYRNPAKTRKGLQESPCVGGGTRIEREEGGRTVRHGRYYIFMGFWYGHGSKFQANLGRK